MKLLHGKVALVAGATRGASRGIAIELGASIAATSLSMYVFMLFIRLTVKRLRKPGKMGRYASDIGTS
ncbi:hypothetical protein [Aneurinibacillus sp. REN35]|uniref:hypothetical protein n=1 Tax=Aneurinibacillus sp. REN35 TaxID=3237286 RepID=UPI0035284245